MREESHLDDMRAAIRGDFERLRARRGSQELLRAPAEPTEPLDGGPEDEADAVASPGSWLARVLGRKHQV